MVTIEVVNCLIPHMSHACIYVFAPHQDWWQSIKRLYCDNYVLLYEPLYRQPNCVEHPFRCALNYVIVASSIAMGAHVQYKLLAIFCCYCAVVPIRFNDPISRPHKKKQHVHAWVTLMVRLEYNPLPSEISSRMCNRLNRGILVR